VGMGVFSRGQSLFPSPGGGSPKFLLLPTYTHSLCFDLERPNSTRYYVGEGRVSRGSATSRMPRAGPQRCPVFEFLMRTPTDVGVNLQVRGRGSATPMHIAYRPIYTPMRPLFRGGYQSEGP